MLKPSWISNEAAIILQIFVVWSSIGKLPFVWSEVFIHQKCSYFSGNFSDLLKKFLIKMFNKKMDIAMDDKFITSTDMLDQRGNIDSPIKDFYKNKVVFLTGGTGFIGKLLIEKLLRWFWKTC